MVIPSKNLPTDDRKTRAQTKEDKKKKESDELQPPVQDARIQTDQPVDGVKPVVELPPPIELAQASTKAAEKDQVPCSDNKVLVVHDYLDDKDLSNFGRVLKLKLPEFWSDYPETWLQQVEAVFWR